MSVLINIVTCVVLVTIVALGALLVLFSIWLICDIVRLSFSLWCRRQWRKHLEEALAAARMHDPGDEV